MRKLVLLGLLAAVFGIALGLEHIVTRPVQPRVVGDHKMILVVGGGPPREVPEEVPAANASEATPRGRRASPPANAGTPSRGPKDPSGAAGAGAGSGGNASAALVGAVHVVQANDTLSKIAREKLGSSEKWKDLARWNGIDDPSALQQGVTLRLTPPDALQTLVGQNVAPTVAPSRDPNAPRTHLVEKGETLSRIAARFLGDAKRWPEIQKKNGLENAVVREGQTLLIPGN